MSWLSNLFGGDSSSGNDSQYDPTTAGSMRNIKNWQEQYLTPLAQNASDLFQSRAEETKAVFLHGFRPTGNSRSLPKNCKP
jgi:hypothetical protein